MKLIELLAPAKDYNQGCAAILCGADALYIGAPRFGARSAAGVSTEDIGRLCCFAHDFGAKVYVAMNTLLWEEELTDAESLAHEIYNAGADALIVQDMSLLRMNLPPIELHASTQMFNMTPHNARFLYDAGFSRLITERALSLDEIRKISASCPIEIEAFIHGAICVSYSGRCWMSRTTSSRSGNRGECSQSCRLPYNLLDETMRPIEKNLHLLSLQDMNMTDHLEGMIDAGVSSFKIEGRLKDMSYVRNIVSWYRRHLDEIISRRSDLTASSIGKYSVEFEPNPAKTFSRGATSYFIDGKRSGVASMNSPKSMGEYLGKAVQVNANFIKLDTPVALGNGDGICFLSADGELCGTNINRTEGDKIYPNKTDMIYRGAEIYRNYDRLYITSVENSRLNRTIDTDARIKVTSDEITLWLSCGGVEVCSSLQGMFDEAKNPQKAEENIRTQISKTGDTIYRIENIVIESDAPRFVPISMLNTLRRTATDALTAKRQSSYKRNTRREENLDTAYPLTTLSGEDNVTNSLSERFYRDHGVTSIERGYDLSGGFEGCRVMQMSYCIRREMGICLKKNPEYKGKLYIENGLHTYELRFDCASCRMEVIYQGTREKITRK